MPKKAICGFPNSTNLLRLDFAISDNDSRIEGFFHTKLPIVGVMWHPERDHAENSELILRNIYDDNFWK